MIDKLNERLTIEKSKAYTDKAGNHRNTWLMIIVSCIIML